MMKRIITMAVAMMPICMTAQCFDYDMTAQQPVYSQETGYGYDILPAPTSKSNEPFYFSVNVPDGNYKVRVVLGAKKKASNTTVRAEGRRLMVENVSLKKGKEAAFEFVVNKRSPKINDKERVRIKEREKTYLAWDNKLTLEFNGDAPAVKSIHIEKDDVCPTIYLCGNSTVVDQNEEPWASWGQMITRWFNENIAISNHAESGLSASTFIGGGRLDKIMATLKKGDYVIVEFGHNDQKEKRPGSGAYYNFSYNLKIFIDRVRSVGAEIIFCTPTQRRSFDTNGKIRETHANYPEAMEAVAKRENVKVIDLHQMTRELFEAMGEEDSKRALVHYPANTFPNQDKPLADNTHFNAFGAYEVAKCVVMGMKKLNLPITQNLRAEFQDFDPNHPDDWKTFKWAPSKIASTVKPDGN